MLRTMGHRAAAIAYIGIDANKYLKLKRGDVLVFDGDERSTKQNHIHLPTIKVLMKSGLSCTRVPFAIVGSANVSRTSLEERMETVVHFDEPDAVMAIRVAVGQWSAAQTALRQVDERRHHEAQALLPLQSHSPGLRRTLSAWASADLRRARSELRPS